MGLDGSGACPTTPTRNTIRTGLTKMGNGRGLFALVFLCTEKTISELENDSSYKNAFSQGVLPIALAVSILVKSNQPIGMATQT